MTDDPLSKNDEGKAPEAPGVASSDANQKLQKANRRLVWQLWIFAAGFLGFGFALVPLYDVLCDITGYGNRKNLTQATSFTASAATSRTVTIEFMSTMPTVGEWEFKPVTNSVKVHTGQLFAATFIAKNLLERPATGQAIPSVAPHEVSQYFHKTECFCFTPQHFEAKQERELTVRFIVDPQLPENIDRITLGYSMYGMSQQIAAVK